MFNLRSRSLQEIRRTHLEATLAQQKETLEAMRQHIEDMREIVILQKAVNDNDKEMKALMAEAAGLKI